MEVFFWRANMSALRDLLGEWRFFVHSDLMALEDGMRRRLLPVI